MLNCRVCRAETSKVISFGEMPIANDFVEDVTSDTYRFNLSASFCLACSLLQIDEQPEPSLMFHDHYPFFTGLSASMTDHFGRMVEEFTSDLETSLSDPLVVEIGSNDGTLLSFVKDAGIRHLGIDPSSNVVEIAKGKGINAEVAFFGLATAEDVASRYGTADLIFAANVICHIPDMNDFASGIKRLLSENAKFVFEEPYIGSMLEKTAYDQIYDEHVYIFGLLSVRKIFARAGLELVDAEWQSTHGGCMRYALMHSGKGIMTPRLAEMLEAETQNGFGNVDIYLKFAKTCSERKNELKTLLTDLKLNGKSVAGYAATSKSATVLNYCGIGPDLIQYISDSTREKQGRFTPGSHIPVISHEEMKKNPPDYLVLFAWNHEREILAKERELTSRGVKWIRFVPSVEILNSL
jgi:methylation protein EvaC